MLLKENDKKLDLRYLTQLSRCACLYSELLDIQQIYTVCSSNIAIEYI